MCYGLTTTIWRMYARALYSAVPKQDTTRPLNLEAVWVHKNAISEKSQQTCVTRPLSLRIQYHRFILSQGK
jgi:hypothetical protein